MFHLTDVEADDGLVEAIWTKPSGGTVTADVHVLPPPDPTFAADGTMMLTTIELVDVYAALHL